MLVKPNNLQIPLLSVCIITYNHEKFIAQALDSVLMQVCDFPVEIIIGEDCSTDETRKICEEYSKTHKNIILITSEKNVGMMKNFLRTSNVCSGKYIAMLEGDDYWTDPYKLQKQVDFLEENPDFILCFHNRNQIENNIISTKILANYGENKNFEGSEVLYAMIHTLTVVFRNILKEHPYPKEFHKLPLYDFALWAYLSLFGKFAYLDFLGATYRLHSKGYYSADNVISGLKKWKYCQIIISQYFPKNYQKEYKKFILMLNFMITEELRSQNGNRYFNIDYLELILRSIKYNNYEYLKFYYSHYKTLIKNRTKNHKLTIF